MARNNGWIWLRCASGAVAGAVLLAVSLVSPSLAECTGEDGGASVVAEIREGETLILGDGRTIRLANTFTPKRMRTGTASDGRAEMEKTLSELVLGKKVELKLGGKQRDRYGRLLAQVMVVNDSGRTWVQERLVSAGLVRVMASGDSRDCTRELLARENEAREAKRGLWKTGYFAVRPAASESMLSGLLHSYEIVEGQVQSVAEVRGRTYINFGQDWHRDFTAVIPEKSTKLLMEAGGANGGTAIEPAKLKGQFVRVRGWIENFNGPSITINQPEQIEVVASAPPTQ